jgi:hypothetical protein
MITLINQTNMKNLELNDLRNVEKVLYKAEYNFAINTLGMTEEQAHDKAMDKIRRTRSLAKIVPRH